jgi:hypothetical protein
MEQKLIYANKKYVKERSVVEKDKNETKKCERMMMMENFKPKRLICVALRLSLQQDYNDDVYKRQFKIASFQLI